MYKTLLTLLVTLLFSCGKKDIQDLLPIEENITQAKKATYSFDGELKNDSLTFNFKNYPENLRLRLIPVSYFEVERIYESTDYPARFGMKKASLNCKVDAYTYHKKREIRYIPDDLLKRSLKFIHIKEMEEEDFSKRVMTSILDNEIMITINTKDIAANEFTISNPTITSIYQYKIDYENCLRLVTEPNFSYLQDFTGKAVDYNFATFIYEFL